MEDLKAAIASYFNSKSLSKKELEELHKIQQKHNIKDDRGFHHLQWGLVAVAASLMIALVGQWYYKPEIAVNKPTEVATIGNNDMVTKNLVLSYVKQQDPDVLLNTMNDIPKHFTALDFTPIDPLDRMPMDNSDLVGASYVQLGDSVGLYIVFEEQDTNKRFVVIQKSMGNDDILEKDMISDGVNVRMWTEKGVLTAVGYSE